MRSSACVVVPPRRNDLADALDLDIGARALRVRDETEMRALHVA
jgi:hypothetical protein